MRVISFLTVIIFFSNCLDNEYIPLTIVNNSNDTIYYCFENKDVLTYNNPIVRINKRINFENSSVILPFDSIILDRHTRSVPWPHYIKGISDKTLRIFFFSHKNIANTSWDSVLKTQYSTKLEKLSIDNLEKNNWIVTYE